MIVALVLVVVALGSVVFHLLSPWWWTPIASNWDYIDATITITFWITGVVFVAVVLFMAWCVFRYRAQSGAAMLAPGLVVWHRFITVPADATEIEIVGQQWLWSYRLPGEDGKLGAVDTRLVGPDNPLGVVPGDPAGQDDLVIQGEELHLPIGRPVKVLLRSIDVLHNFYVPEFRAKMDMIPGSVTFFWFTPTRIGTFDVLCAELCGSGHAVMRGRVVVATPEEHQAWLQGRRRFAQAGAQAR
jgi:cytochrome c oxidase subunit 2